jgi:hypothetical protein
MGRTRRRRRAAACSLAELEDQRHPEAGAGRVARDDDLAGVDARGNHPVEGALCVLESGWEGVLGSEAVFRPEDGLVGGDGDGTHDAPMAVGRAECVGAAV